MSLHPRVLLLIFLIVALLSLGLAGGKAGGQAGAPAGKEATKEQLLEQKQKLEQTIQAEGSVLEALEEIDKSVQQQESQLDELRARQKAVEVRIASLQQERVDLEVGLADRRVQLQKRLRALYKYSNKGFMQALLGGGTGTEILKRMKYLQIIIRRDMDLIAQQRQNLERFAEVKSTLETERLQVKELARQVEQQVTTAQEERLRKQALLTRLRGERGAEARRLKELEAAAAALAAAVNKKAETPAVAKPTAPEPPSPLRAKVDDKQGFANQISRLPFPVPGGKVTRAFGRYKVEGMKASETHRGLDITAPAGTEIKAIFQGEVKLAEWFKGYGLLIIVDHGDGFHSIYAHASKLLKKAGDKVKTGERIALVGDTGSFQGAYLYLEVRESGKPVNPIQWVRVPADAMAIE